MTRKVDYEFSLVLYHNNYINVQRVAAGLDAAKADNDQDSIKYFKKLDERAIEQENEFFQLGVEAAGGDARKFLADVLNKYPDINDSQKYQERLNEVNAQHTGVTHNEGACHSQIKLTTTVNVAGAVQALAADRIEAYGNINKADFNYLTQAQKDEYVHIYAEAKFQQNARLDVNPALGYLSFSKWAKDVMLREEDWIKLAPTPVTQNHIIQGLLLGGIPNPLIEPGRSI